MSDFSLRNVDLSGSKVQSGGGLPEGRHVCRVTDAAAKPTSNGQNLQIEVILGEVNGKGGGRDYITVQTKSSDEGNKMAVHIGLERLKALMTHGGHPNPELLGEVKELVGLTVGVVFEKDEDYTDKVSGEKRPGGVKPRRNGAYFNPAALGHSPGQRAAGADMINGPAKVRSDDIPF